jgi:hypothetical protein
MSRVYAWDDEPYPNASELFQRSVDNAMKGKSGQALLREIEAALLAMPEKKLIADGVCDGGEVCLLGSVAVARAVAAGKTREEALADLERGANEAGQYQDDGNTFKFLKRVLGIKQHCLAWQLVFQNDECYATTSEQRYERMLAWVREMIVRVA